MAVFNASYAAMVRRRAQRSFGASRLPLCVGHFEQVDPRDGAGDAEKCVNPTERRESLIDQALSGFRLREISTAARQVRVSRAD